MYLLKTKFDINFSFFGFRYSEKQKNICCIYFKIGALPIFLSQILAVSPAHRPQLWKNSLWSYVLLYGLYRNHQQYFSFHCAILLKRKSWCKNSNNHKNKFNIFMYNRSRLVQMSNNWRAMRGAGDRQCVDFATRPPIDSRNGTEPPEHNLPYGLSTPTCSSVPHGCCKEKVRDLSLQERRVKGWSGANYTFFDTQ